jgi:hypothetical protein
LEGASARKKEQVHDGGLFGEDAPGSGEIIARELAQELSNGRSSIVSHNLKYLDVSEVSSSKQSILLLLHDD